MLDSLLKLISDKKISHLIYISSDAVYEDSLKKMTENSSIKPNSLHGIMHCVREDLLKLYFKNNLSIVRPTLVYGPQDTHNGYGPNYFARNALQNRNIHVFGNGEELRDHVYIDDVSQLIFEILNKKKWYI